MPARFAGEARRPRNRLPRVERDGVQVPLENSIGRTQEEQLPAPLVDVDELDDHPLADGELAQGRAVGRPQLEVTKPG